MHCLRCREKKAAVENSIIYFEQIHEAVANKDFSKICDGLEAHQLWSRDYILKNLETVKNRF